MGSWKWGTMKLSSNGTMSNRKPQCNSAEEISGASKKETSRHPQLSGLSYSREAATGPQKQHQQQHQGQQQQKQQQKQQQQQQHQSSGKNSINSNNGSSSGGSNISGSNIYGASEDIQGINQQASSTQRPVFTGRHRYVKFHASWFYLVAY